MRNAPWLIFLLLLTSACAPSLGNGDDDDSVSDDDDSVSDDDDSVSDDDDDVVVDDDDTPPPYRPGIVFSSSFGNCAGDCRSDLGIGTGETVAVYVTSNWENQIGVEREGELSDLAVESLARELDAVDPGSLEAVYGCPDCADGGAREIVWDLGPVARIVSYEYGNPPAVLASLDDVLASIEEEIATCNYGLWFVSIPACDPIAG